MAEGIPQNTAPAIIRAPAIISSQEELLFSFGDCRIERTACFAFWVVSFCWSFFFIFSSSSCCCFSSCSLVREGASLRCSLGTSEENSLRKRRNSAIGQPPPANNSAMINQEKNSDVPLFLLFLLSIITRPHPDNMIMFVYYTFFHRMSQQNPFLFSHEIELFLKKRIYQKQVCTTHHSYCKPADSI